MKLFNLKRKLFDPDPDGITDKLIALMISLFVIIIIYVSVLQTYIAHNVTGTAQTFANIAVWFIFLAIALSAIYMAIGSTKRR
jgi:hypothetical protein